MFKGMSGPAFRSGTNLGAGITTRKITMAWSVLKRYSASALASSVLPTPVGPKNMNEAIGRFGSPMPARDLCATNSKLKFKIQNLN